MLILVNYIQYSFLLLIVSNDQQGIAVNVYRAAYICLANSNAAAPSFVAILAKTTASVHVPRVLRNVETTAVIECANGNVVTLVSRAKRSAVGSACIITAQSHAENHVTDQGVISPAKRSCRATTCALVSVAKNVRSCAEFVTKSLMSSAGMNPKLCSWNWWTADTYLK